MKILYVEDDETNAFVIRHMLREHQVIWADSSTAAMSLCSGKVFDLVLMDINLGEKSCDGVELMNRIQAKHKAFQEVPFYAVTAYTMNDAEQHFLSLGFDRYFSKPVHFAKMKEAVADLASSLEDDEASLCSNVKNPL